MRFSSSLLCFLMLPLLACACASDLDCSLNGVCSDAVCRCDKPWQGASCGVLGYAVTPAAAKSLYPVNDSRNTWNGPIVHANGQYHMYNPLYKKGSLGGKTKTLHGIADRIEGPYAWDLPVVSAGFGKHNLAAFVFPDEDGKPAYALWFCNGPVLLADSPFGPFTRVNGSFKVLNPAPVYHQGAFYVTSQHTEKIWTAPALSGPWTVFATISLGVQTGPGTPYGVLEDPFMWIDKRGNWHIINHAYDVTQTESCASSTLSAHLFSVDGKSWQILDPKVEPYGHTVVYDDGSEHTYITLERPFLYFDEQGQLTHLSLAADLVTGDEGCKNIPNCHIKPEQGQCACTNCKWTDHAGTIIIQLDVSASDTIDIDLI